jgi:hypothetical protein
MLFISVMDVLTSLFTKAESKGLLRPLHSTGQRLSLYANARKPQKQAPANGIFCFHFHSQMCAKKRCQKGFPNLYAGQHTKSLHN